MDEWPRTPGSPESAEAPGQDSNIKDDEEGKSTKKRGGEAQVGGEELADSQEEKAKVGRPKE